MSSPATPLRLHAIHVDPDDDTETLLGEIAVAADGMVSVLSGHQEHLEFLEDFARTVNGKPRLLVKVPPVFGAGMFELEGQIYERTDANFVAGLKLWADKYYALRLSTDEERNRELQELEDLSL